jgi:hypothetical protein
MRGRGRAPAVHVTPVGPTQSAKYSVSMRALARQLYAGRWPPNGHVSRMDQHDVINRCSPQSTSQVTIQFAADAAAARAVDLRLTVRRAFVAVNSQQSVVSHISGRV